MDLKNFHQSKTLRGVLIGIGVALIVLAIFQAGLMVGYRRAMFADRVGNFYYRAFGNENRDFEALPGGHGAAGKVAKITLPTFVIEQPNNTEETVRITDDTEIRRFRQSVGSDQIKINDLVVVLGSPNSNGEVAARLIRLLPPPPARATSTASSSLSR